MTAKTRGPAPPAPALDPDEMLTGPMVARELGISPKTWRAYQARRGQPGGAGVPEPDGREPLTGTPYWYRRTITTWREQRQGSGWRKGVLGTHADRQAGEHG